MSLTHATNRSTNRTTNRIWEFQSSLIATLPRLEARARRLTPHAAEAKDLTQETCRRALEAQAQFVPGSNFQAWLNRILRNLYYDLKRHAALEVLTADASLIPNPAKDERLPLWRTVSDEAVAQAIAALPREYGDTYALYAFEGLSYKEIGVRLGIPVRTVGTRMNRARLRLRPLILRDQPKTHRTWMA
jgi:RNA polymerase sigma-70 factor (ECF subfamily)